MIAPFRNLAGLSPAFWFRWHWAEGDFTPSGAVAYWRTNTAGVKALIAVDFVLLLGLVAMFYWFSGAQS
jgi:hypothetical protein